VGPIIYVITYCFSKSRDLSQSQIKRSCDRRTCDIVLRIPAN
jgi:hypothetical protein